MLGPDRSGVNNCACLGCSLKASANAADHANRVWGLCRRHAEIVVRAIAGRFLVDVVERPGKDPRVDVRQPARYSAQDWATHYRLLECAGHMIRANGAAFAEGTDPVPINVLICACGWRGHYRMWPQHLRASAGPRMSAAPGPDWQELRVESSSPRPIATTVLSIERRLTS